MCRVSYPVYSVNAVANCILEIGKEKGIPITNLKLQKLVYFAQGWALARLDHPLFAEEIQAWTYGPVIPELYAEAKRYENKAITDEFVALDKVPQNSEEMRVIKEVMVTLGGLQPMQLVNLSHRGDSPWAAAWRLGKYSPVSLWQMVVYFRDILYPKQPQEA